MSTDLRKEPERTTRRLRDAADLIRNASACIPDDEAGLAIVAWLSAEAEHYERFYLQGAALNFLIATSAAGDMRDWRVQLHYSTHDKALAVADAILGGAL